MNHLSAMFLGDLDDFTASQVSTDRGVLASLANDISFVSLYEMVSPGQSLEHRCRTAYSVGAC
jgi:hypothetical protein